MTPFAPNTPGIWFDLPAKDYHAAPGFSQSMAKHISPPARLLQYLEKPNPETEFTRMGSLVHQRILEPAQPLPGFAVIPEEYPAPADSSLVKTKKVAVGDMVKWSWNAKFCQKWREIEEAKGNEVIEQSELDRLCAILEAVARNKDARGLLSRGRSEVSCFWYRETAFGPVLCKTRQDFVLSEEFVAMADLKIVQRGKAETEEFSSLILERGYHVQAAANIEGWNHHMPHDLKSLMVFIAVEREQPRPEFVNCVSVPEDVLRAGQLAWAQAVETYARCKAENRWPGVGTGINPMILKRWERERFGI